jgi:hypothetical protein
MIKKDVGVKVGQIWRDHLGTFDNDPKFPISERRHVKVVIVGNRLDKYGNPEQYAEIIPCSPDGVIPLNAPRKTKARVDRFGKSGGYVLVRDVKAA